MATTNAQPAKKPRFRKILHSLDMTLFTVCAILIIDQLAASASIGIQSVFWWIVTLLLFFIPYGLITAELGSTYRQEGGLYAWVRRAFGARWAGRAAWLWWVNVAFWMPSVYILFAGILSQMINPQMPLMTKLFITLILTWITVGVNIVTLEIGKWIPNIGAIFKVILMLVVGGGGIFYAMQHGVANQFTLNAFMPSWGASLAFLPVILYNYLGFELMSGASEEMDDPAHDVPKAIIISGCIIAFFYILGTVGILLALPLNEIGLIGGMMDMFNKLFSNLPYGREISFALGLMALYSLVANMVTWTLGANRSAAAAANRGDLPAVFGKLHPRYNTPASSAILGGAIASIVLLIYGYMADSAEDLFWTVFAFSSVIFLLCYFLLFMAFIRLRHIDADLPRSYRVPGGDTVATTLSIVCMIFIAQAIVFLIYKPGKFTWPYALSIVGGVGATLIAGEFMLPRREARTA